MNTALAQRAEALALLQRRLTELLALFDGPDYEVTDLERAVKHCEGAFARLSQCGETPRDVGPVYRERLQETVRLHAIVRDCLAREFASLDKSLGDARRLQNRLPFYGADAGASCDISG